MAPWAREVKEGVMAGLGRWDLDISNVAKPLRTFVLVYNLAGKKEMCIAEEMTVVVRRCFSAAWRTVQ